MKRSQVVGYKISRGPHGVFIVVQREGKQVNGYVVDGRALTDLDIVMRPVSPVWERALRVQVGDFPVDRMLAIREWVKSMVPTILTLKFKLMEA